MQLNPSMLVDRARAIEMRKVLGGVGLGALVILASVSFGLLATTANPLLVGLGAGLIGGSFLLVRPQLVIWAILILGLISGVFISLAGPAFSKLSWVISIMSFLLMAIALVKLPGRKNLPVFFWLALCFMLMSVGSSVVQWYSAAEFFAGFKRYFQAFGLMMALAVLPLALSDFARWRKLLLVIALLQLPFALYEFFILVPLRGGLGSPGSTDVVAGTFEANLVGGSANAPMATFIIIVFAFLVSRWKRRLITTSSLVLLGLPCFATFFLGEVKIVFVMLPLIFIIIFRDDIIRKPVFFLLSALTGGVLLVALSFVYAEVFIGKSFSWVVMDTLDYNFGHRGYGASYLNRTTVLSFWWQQQGLHDPLGFFIGHGLGSSFSSTQTFVPGHIAAKWPQYGIGFTSASTLLWDTGILGFTLFLSILLWAWRASDLIRRQAAETWMRADAIAIQAAIALFLLLVFYQNSLVNYLQLEIVMAVVLGYLAYLYQIHRTHLAHAASRFAPPLPNR